MGKAIEKTNFTEHDFAAFSGKLHDCLEALEEVLAIPDFGKGKPSIGAELELYLLDANETPLAENVAIQQRFANPQLTLELNRYNLEYNLSPVVAAGEPFAALEKQMMNVLERLRTLTAERGGSVLPIGILPTLRRKDFGAEAMTDEPRYRALSKILRKMRDQSFGINIDGLDPIRLVQDDVTLEGACTSFQLHYRTDPDRFTALWNSIQLVTPVVLGLAVNSPLLLGHRLWQETRVPLFKQAIDGREAGGYGWRNPARVSFGHGWLRGGAMELFRQTVQLYPPLIPLVSSEKPKEVIAKGEVPVLTELSLHDGTIWSWNRPIFDPGQGGHLRIEMRALPAGPTPLDMAANAALFIGLAEGLTECVDELITGLPFSYAEYNFYRAAQFGLHANILWPSAKQNGLREKPLLEVAEDLLPLAERGLAGIGVEQQEIRRLLTVIERRLQTKRTGAEWQLSQFANFLHGGLSRQQACRRLVGDYRVQSASNNPVAEWSDY